MAVTWAWYISRTRINVEQWLRHKGLTTYDSLVSELNRLGVTPPPLTQVGHYFENAFPSAEKVKMKSDEKKWGIVNNSLEPKPELQPELEELESEPKIAVVEEGKEKGEVNKWGIVEKQQHKKKSTKSKK